MLSNTQYMKGILSSLGGDHEAGCGGAPADRYNVEAIGRRVHCKVFVQNTANVRRHQISFDSYVKKFEPARARMAAAKAVNALLEQVIAGRSSVAAKLVVMIAMLPLARQYGGAAEALR